MPIRVEGTIDRGACGVGARGAAESSAALVGGAGKIDFLDEILDRLTAETDAQLGPFASMLNNLDTILGADRIETNQHGA